MDEDKIDKELSDHIRQVFDQYEDPAANEGWLLLRERYPEKKKDRAMAWLWYAAAAVVVMFLGVWLLRKPNAGNDQQFTTIKKSAEQHQQTGSASSQDTTIGTDTATTSGQLVQQSPQVGQTPGVAPVHGLAPVHQSVNGEKPLVNQLADQFSAGNTPLNTNPNTGINPVQSGNSTGLPANILPGQSGNLLTGNTSAQTQPVQKTIDADSAAKANAQRIAANSPIKNQQPDQQANSAAAMQRLLAQTSGPDDKKQPGKNNRKPLIGVYAATYFNYAKGSDNQLNVGAGISSDFKLTKNLRLSTGIAIGQNRLNYNNDLSLSTATAMADFAFAAAPITGISNQNNAVANTGSPAQVKKSSSASLVGLDIPVNLKFQFDPDKTDTYIAAGLSSGTFINETYTNVYSYGQTTQQSTSTKNFSGFDVAKTLNLSFGMGYPLGKSNRLVIEPFVKYPLDGLGSQQIKFGAGGVNLKLNFTTHKK